MNVLETSLVCDKMYNKLLTTGTKLNYFYCSAEVKPAIVLVLETITTVVHYQTNKDMEFTSAFPSAYDIWFGSWVNSKLRRV